MQESGEMIESASMNTSPQKGRKKERKICLSAHYHTLWLYIEEKQGGKKKEKECPLQSRKAICIVYLS
jgi:hypothetical protein